MVTLCRLLDACKQGLPFSTHRGGMYGIDTKADRMQALVAMTP